MTSSDLVSEPRGLREKEFDEIKRRRRFCSYAGPHICPKLRQLAERLRAEKDQPSPARDSSDWDHEYECIVRIEELRRVLLDFSRQPDDLFEAHRKVVTIIPGAAELLTRTKTLNDLRQVTTNVAGILLRPEVATERIEDKTTCGLALSGGGVRSATFNLGVLEELHENGLLEKADYLSTVSGGGYIGTSLTHFMNRGLGFPFRRETGIVDHIRCNAAYLTPGRGLNKWALSAAILRGILINLVLMLPLLFGLMWILTYSCVPSLADWPGAAALRCRPGIFGSATEPWIVTLAVLGGLSAIAAVRGFFRRWERVIDKRKEGANRRYELAWVLMMLAVCVLGIAFDDLRVAVRVMFALLVLMVMWEAFREGDKKDRYLPRWVITTILVLVFAFGIAFAERGGGYGNYTLLIPVSFALTFGMLSILDDKWKKIGVAAAALGLIVLAPFSEQLGWSTPAQLYERAEMGAIAAAVVVIVVTLVCSLALKSESGDRIRKWGYVVFETLAWVGVFGVVNLLWKNIERVSWYPPIMAALVLIGCAILARMLIGNLFYAALSQSHLRLSAKAHVYFSVQYGDLLAWGSLLLGIGLIPWVHYVFLDFWGTYGEKALQSISIAGVISTVAGWVARTPGAETRGYVAFLLRTGVILLLVSGLLWIYDFIAFLPAGNTSGLSPLVVLAILLFLLASATTDINYASMHRFYRNRLTETFLGANQGEETDAVERGELHSVDIGRSGAPYHLINTNLVTVGSRKQSYANRLGDSFVFSPLFIGSRATRWAQSNVKAYEEMNLGTAMSISGAAVDPNTGATQSWPLRIVMGLLNVRLGYWLMSPEEQERKRPIGWIRRVWHESWVVLATREILGFPREDWEYVRLSDGGHFENLGLYELVRRRCRVIIACDAGADPDWSFSDLSRAIERVRVDFGADVNIDMEALKPRRESGLARVPFVVGEIQYLEEDGEETNSALFVFIKTALFAGLPQDVIGYAHKHPAFPDEPTTDQFFTEEQFEAYRMLGRHATRRMLKDCQRRIEEYLPQYIR